MSYTSEFSLTVGDAGRWFGLAAGIFPRHEAYQVPRPGDCGLQDAARSAEVLQWCGQALRTALEAEAAHPQDFSNRWTHADLDRWLEIASLLRSAGDAFKLAVASTCEIRGLLDVTQADSPAASPILAAFVAEATAQYLMSVGHNLTNAAFRVCLTSGPCVHQLASANSRVRKAMRSATPGNDDRSAWLFHSEAAKVSSALGQSRAAPVRMMKVATRLHSRRSWKAANEARDVYFHRWRRGFAGGDRESYDAAAEFHTATLGAAQCLGRAVPSYYHGLLASLPRLRRGPSRGASLLGNPTTMVGKKDENGAIAWESEEPMLPNVPFWS